MRLPTSLEVEHVGPFVVAIVATVLWGVLGNEISSYFAKELLAALISAAAISAGFLTTAFTLLLPMSTTKLGEKLARSGYQREMFRYLRAAIYGAVALAGFCVGAFFALAEGKPLPLFWSCLVVFTAVYAASALVRIADVLMKIFEIAANSPD